MLQLDFCCHLPTGPSLPPPLLSPVLSGPAVSSKISHLTLLFLCLKPISDSSLCLEETPEFFKQFTTLHNLNSVSLSSITLYQPHPISLAHTHSPYTKHFLFPQMPLLLFPLPEIFSIQPHHDHNHFLPNSRFRFQHTAHLLREVLLILSHGPWPPRPPLIGIRSASFSYKFCSAVCLPHWSDSVGTRSFATIFHHLAQCRIRVDTQNTEGNKNLSPQNMPP